jgi:hypothetical protein
MRFSTIECLLAQLVVAMTKNNAPTHAGEGIKDHDHVGDLVVATLTLGS